MNILAIDSGSYSVKFLEGHLERKNFVVDNVKEILIQDARANLDQNLTLYEVQHEIIKSYVGDGFTGKVIQHVPNNMITSRNISIPVLNKKKADMMIPFQLEENLPFPAHEAHIARTLIKKDKKIEAYIQLAKKSHFEDLYRGLESRHILPSLLTSELSVYQNFVRENNFKRPVAILDIGHQSTKGYFINEGEICFNHISLIAGAHINTVISETYDIPMAEAVLYKHQNCFFLTEDQYDQVSKEQQDFATIMKQTIWPLVQDLKRWELGYRVKYGHSIETIYLTGGTTQINNLANFLSEVMEIKVEFLSIPDDIHDPTEGILNNESTMGLSLLMAYTQKYKNTPSNFLYGAFSGTSAQGLPLHSLGFIGSRVAIVSLILFSLLMIERHFFLNPSLKSMNRKITTLLKSPNLGLSSRIRNQFRRRPERVLSALKQKRRSISQEVQTIQASSKIDAFSPLGTLSRLLVKNEKVDLIEFRSNGKETFGIFRSDSLQEIENYAKNLKKLGLSNLGTKFDKKLKTVSIKFEGK